MNLEIPLQAVYDERNIKAITQDTQLILKVPFLLFFLFKNHCKKALKKTKNVEVSEEKMILIPIIKALTNKIILNNLQPQDEEEFKKFLQKENWTSNVKLSVF